MGARTRTRIGRAAAAVMLLGAVVVGTTGPVPAAAADKPVIVSIAPSSGPVEGGHTVIVTGSGFIAGDTGVFVDGVYLDAEVLSPTSLSFVAPPHPAGTVALLVTVGDSDSAAHTLRYLSPPTVIESPTATPSAQDDGEQSVDPAPRRRQEPTQNEQHDPAPPARDPGSRVPPELAATGSASADLALLGVDALLAGALLLIVTRRRGTRLER